MNVEQVEPTTVRRYIPRELDTELGRAAALRGLSIQDYLSTVVLPFVEADFEDSVRKLASTSKVGG